MEWVETTGRTIEEAKERALDQLGVDELDAEFDIVEEPKFGLFGRLRSEARVRARVRPTTPRPKEDRRDRRRRRPRSDTAEDTPSRDRPDEAQASDDRRAPPASAASKADVSAGATAQTATATATTSTPPSRSARRGGRRNETGAGAAGRSSSSAETDGLRRSGERPDETDDEGAGMMVPLDEQAKVARQFLDGLFGEMDVTVEITVEQPDDDTVEINVEGQDLGLLIGPKGATLLALQDLTRTVVQRRTSAANGRLMVDVGGYRHKRKEALERFARQVAEQVRAGGAPKALEPMTAADRKTVHDTINDIEGVSTTSEGEEPQRRVVIIPATS
jgi:spoIIIJ-associated protein